MEKTEFDNTFNQRVKDRRSKATKPKDLLMDFLLLLLPTIGTMVLGFLSAYSFFLSLLLLYFLLPMYYTVEERMRARLTSIGNPDFTYSDGYKAFFSSNQGGVFGAFSTLFISLGIALVVALLLSPALPGIVSLFDGASEVFTKLGSLYTNPTTTQRELNDYLLQNGAVLSRPLTIYIGLILFLPIFYAIFFQFDNNLIDHHIASIVLPDLDKNVSASMARSLARKSFGRISIGFRYKEDFRRNYPYYLLYIAFYGASLYLCSYLQAHSFRLVLPFAMITPICSLFYGVYFNHFALINKFTIAEESKEKILDGMPDALRSSISRTFSNPSYIHGEESEKRGPFLPEDKKKVEEKQVYQDEKEGEGVKGVLLDLSHIDKGSSKGEDEEK